MRVADAEDAAADGAASTRSSRARRPRVTACRSRASRTRTSTSTSSPTGSGRRSGSRTGTSRTTSRWSRTSRSRRRRASPACAGTRSGGSAGRTASTSRARTRRATASTAGWAASPRTRRATWRSATASSTGVDVFPGIRYTGRLAGDPLGQMTLGEGTIINGSGVQRTTNSRWGDYTDMTVDPVDDCTFWYVNEYYTAGGPASSRQAGRRASPASSCRAADPLTRPGPARRVPSRRPLPLDEATASDLSHGVS